MTGSSKAVASTSPRISRELAPVKPSPSIAGSTIPGVFPDVRAPLKIPEAGRSDAFSDLLEGKCRIESEAAPACDGVKGDASTAPSGETPTAELAEAPHE
jgi:hypothetical protein